MTMTMHPEQVGARHRVSTLVEKEPAARNMMWPRDLLGHMCIRTRPTAGQGPHQHDHANVEADLTDLFGDYRSHSALNPYPYHARSKSDFGLDPGAQLLASERAASSINPSFKDRVPKCAFELPVITSRKEAPLDGQKCGESDDKKIKKRTGIRQNEIWDSKGKEYH